MIHFFYAHNKVSIHALLNMNATDTKKKPRDFSRGRFEGEFQNGLFSVVVTLTTAEKVFQDMNEFRTSEKKIQGFCFCFCSKRIFYGKKEIKAKRQKKTCQVL